MRSIYFTPKSALAISVLIQALESFGDIEDDYSIDLAQQLKYGNKHFDETLSEVVDMRRRVRCAKNFIEGLKRADVGNEVFFGPEALEIADRALEVTVDILRDACTEAFHTKEFRDGTDAEGMVRLREKVEQAINRAETAIELLREFRAIPR